MSHKTQSTLRRPASLVLAAALALSLAAPALTLGTVEPVVKQGPDWVQVEEPALRPYKGFWEGLKALGFHSVQALAEGNHKFPGLGSVEVFRGVRRGTVELATNTYTSMAGSRPRPYYLMGATNQFIESDPLLRTTADAATTMGVTRAFGAVRPVGWAAGAFVAQGATDLALANPELRRELADQRRINRQMRRRAQENYIGDRARINRTPPGRGNLLRDYR